MTESKIQRASTFRVRNSYGKKPNMKRSSSFRVIENLSKDIEIISIQKTNNNSKCLHKDGNQFTLSSKNTCDECKCLRVQQEDKMNVIIPSIVNKRSDERNKNRRSARPLRKLQAIDE